MSNVTPINGHDHDAHRVLDDLRNAQCGVANALYIAGKHLEAARAIAAAYNLPYAIPAGTAINDIAHQINKELMERKT